MYEISIIIPVYNAESTLNNTIDSVISQSFGFENIELILVDDNSTDSSKDIIMDYSIRYDNVKPIFLKQNSGHASHPRNIGIDQSSGKYLLFMDSDDEIFPDYCEILFEKIVENDVQIVNCNHASKLNDTVYIPKSIYNINFSQKVCDDVEKMFLNHTAWGNIYDSSLIKGNNIKFPDSLHEDGVFSVNCLLNTNRPVIYLPNYPGYIYSIGNDDSLSNNLSLESMALFLKGYKLCDDLLKKHQRFDIEQRLMGVFINMSIFILLKLDNLDEGIRMLYEFEKSFDFDVILGSKPLNFINDKIKNRSFKQAKIILKILKVFYNTNLFRNAVFIRYSNLKVLNE